MINEVYVCKSRLDLSFKANEKIMSLESSSSIHG
jgi:hypothetical protein